MEVVGPNWLYIGIVGAALLAVLAVMVVAALVVLAQRRPRQ